MKHAPRPVLLNVPSPSALEKHLRAAQAQLRAAEERLERVHRALTDGGTDTETIARIVRVLDGH